MRYRMNDFCPRRTRSRSSINTGKQLKPVLVEPLKHHAEDAVSTAAAIENTLLPSPINLV